MTLLQGRDGSSLADYLDGLFSTWTGWTGTRRWESVGSELAVDATHHRAFIRLVFELHQDDRPDAWVTRVSIDIEPGEACT